MSAQEISQETPAPTVAQTYMSALKSCGSRRVFANGGTDFAPIIEGILMNWKAGGDMPEFVTVPHENDGARQRGHRQHHLRTDERRAR